MTSKKKEHKEIEEPAADTEATATFAAISLDEKGLESVTNDEGVTPDNDAAAEDDELPTIRSLGRLEGDLQRLQQSWADVELELARKEQEISYLADERDMHLAAFKSLQADLDEQTDEHDRLQATIGEIEAKLAEAEERLESHGETVAERDKAIEELKEARAAVVSDCDALKATLAGKEEELKRREGEFKTLQADAEAARNSLGEVQTTRQELEAYIDRRKEEWDKLNGRLDEYSDALEGLRAELDAKEKEIAGNDAAKAALRAEIESLQRQCAELDGRRAEREDANRQLTDLLAAKSQEIESLQKERDDASAGSSAMMSRMQDQVERIAVLEHELNELNIRVKDIRKTADKEIEDNRNESREELRAMSDRLDRVSDESSGYAKAAEKAEAKVSELSDELAAREYALEQLRDANNRLEDRLTAEATRLDELREEATAAGEDRDRVQAEFDDYQERTEQQLDANTDLIGELESELERRNAAIEALEQNADKLGAINDHVQLLDARILQGVGSVDTDGRGACSRNLMVAVNGMPGIRFPLYKRSMTIGRGSESDIQLRRKFISRRHARVTEDEEGVRIEDLGSKNGIYVNEQPVKEAYLHNGDVVDIGEVQLRFVEQEEAA